jgi:hypothetical protein
MRFSKGKQMPDFNPLFPADALAASGLPVRANERSIYDLIATRRGHTDPISIEVIRRVTGLTERSIKGAVAELIVSHKVLIGASRKEPIGYFMIESEEDRAIASEPLKGQIIQMLRRLRVLNSVHQVREWLGQQAVGETGGGE